MRVLFVCSYKETLPNNMAPFIWEQVESLSRQNFDIRFFLVRGKGVKGYIKSFTELRKAIIDSRPDIIHAHYGLCGLLANLQREIPVVTTYHGSDINDSKVRWLSKLAILLSKENIFVAQSQLKFVNPRKHYAVIPCGISLEVYQEIDKKVAREKTGLDLEKEYVLFAGAFDNAVKNYPLAKAAMDMIPKTELLELKGHSREQVALLMNAVDCLLMTSHTEGSPQVIKEAMACGCPIISVDVGDVAEVIRGVDGCFIVERDSQVIANTIQNVLSENRRTEGRKRIIELGLTNNIVANRLIDIYNQVIG